MMNRQNLPAPAAEPDMAARVTEIRMAERSRGHEARNGREVIA